MTRIAAPVQDILFTGGNQCISGPWYPVTCLANFFFFLFFAYELAKTT